MQNIKKDDLYDEFWQFAYKRQEIFYNKLINKLPLTDDAILMQYKFCNAYRVLDRVSQYLIKEVIYKDFSPEDMIFRIVLFKIFNLPSTWEELERNFAPISIKTFNFEKFSKVLSKLKEKQPIYNNAYISCANKVFGFQNKHDNHLKLIEKMFLEDRVAQKLLNCKNMEEGYRLLLNYPLIGSFMAYQLVTDINYSDAVNWRENEFTVAGPGAQRGIKKVFSKFTSYEDVIIECYCKQREEFARLNLDFKFLGSHELQYIDIQNLFCEFDKYCRQSHPELKSNRVRIKTKYKPNMTKIDYIFPKKWKITLNY